MKKHKALSIISATLLAASSICFLTINHFYQEPIDKIADENNQITLSLQVALDQMLKATSEQELQVILKDHIDILKATHCDTNTLKKKEEMFYCVASNAVIYAQNAAQSTNISLCNVDSTLSLLDKTKKAHDQFIKYMNSAGKRTFQLDSLKKQNQKETFSLSKSKHLLWNISFVLQSFGLALGIIAIAF